MQRHVACDSDLQDVCFGWEFDKGQEPERWLNMGTFVLPATSRENLLNMHDIAASGED